MFVACVVGAFLLQAVTPSPRTEPVVPGVTARSVGVGTAGVARTVDAPIDARLVPHWASVRNDTNPRRRRAVEYSDWYYRRLLIHRWGSYLELPVFAAEYYLGQRLLDGTDAGWVKPAHVATAVTLGALFSVNTVTGVWNLWESRTSTDRRALIWTHSALMLAADLGFAITPTLIDDDAGANFARTHRDVALGSMGVATLATLIMWYGPR